MFGYSKLVKQCEFLTQMNDQAIQEIGSLKKKIKEYEDGLAGECIAGDHCYKCKNGVSVHVPLLCGNGRSIEQIVCKFKIPCQKYEDERRFY